MYGLRCVAYEHPDLEVEFNAFVESDKEMCLLVAELGRKLKAGAVVKQIRDGRVVDRCECCYVFKTLSNATGN